MKRRSMSGARRAIVKITLNACCTPLYAQPYPSKPVRLIAPFPPGGSSDLIARILAQKMSEGLGPQMIVENRPGAGSNLGTQAAARAAPDGYTLLITSVTAAINATQTGRLRTRAVTGAAARTPLTPKLPTVTEAGIPGYTFDSWWGLVTNSSVPQPVIDRLYNETRRVLALPEVKERFADLGIDVLQGSTAELASFTRSEIERMAKVIRETGIRTE